MTLGRTVLAVLTGLAIGGWSASQAVYSRDAKVDRIDSFGSTAFREYQKGTDERMSNIERALETISSDVRLIRDRMERPK